MKLRLMDFLVCPHCAGELKLSIEKQETNSYSNEQLDVLKNLYKNRDIAKFGEDWETFLGQYTTEIREGKLSCASCGSEFLIESGVPRMLPEHLKTQAGQLGRGDPENDARIAGYMDEVATVSKDDDRFLEIQRANQSNYGYEWQAFSHEYGRWESLYARYSGVDDQSYFEGKLGLDAGCGMARYSLVPVTQGAEMVGVDLSNAVEAAYKKSRDVPMLHVVQGDIFNLPFRKDFFDFGQSLGVIHITPNPELALQSICSVVRKGGKLSLYVYSNFEDVNKVKFYLLKVVNQIRRLTVKMPSNQLYKLLYLFIPPVILFLYLPSRLLWHLGFKKTSMRFPYSYEQYRNRRLRDFHMNLFDRFGNPVERRYNRKQMKDWMDSAKVQNYELMHRDGWVVVGVNGRANTEVS